MAQVVGADELEEVLQEFGISGDDDVVGADPNPARRVMQKVRGALAKRVLVPNSAAGRPRQFPLLFTRSIGLADDAADTVTATPDRAAMVRALCLQANSAAGALLYGLSLTSLTVQGRNAKVGSGYCPDFALRTWALQAMSSLELGMVSANGPISIGVVNACGAAVDVSCGALAETTD